MLRGVNDLQGFAVRATDGTIGHVKDFYFDDAVWVIRYLVVDAGTWLSSRKVLVSPIALGYPNWLERVLPVLITKEQVKNSPEIDTERPVTRQHEMRYLGYYGYPFYWGGAGLWAGGIYPNMMVPDYAGFASAPDRPQSATGQACAQAEAARHQDDDPHLRSCKAVLSYHIQANDGDIGHVQDLLVDEETWAIRYMIVDTSNWWLGHKVLVAPQWIRNVSWHDATVSIDLTQQAVKAAPAYDSTAALNREQETGIYEHYGRPAYWVGEARGPKPGD